jgi:hypothetical protein
VTLAYAVLAFAIAAALPTIAIRIARRRRDTPRKDDE